MFIQINENVFEIMCLGKFEAYQISFIKTHIPLQYNCKIIANILG